MIGTEAAAEILPPMELPAEVVVRITKKYEHHGEKAVREALETAKKTRREIGVISILDIQ